MLTIGKLGTSRGRLEYYDAQVAAGAEDYYAGRGESAGQWQGSGARAPGLTPGSEVARAEFLALMRGLNPRDGSLLRPMGARSTVAGLDLTFLAPKSVSVLFAIADETVAAALLASHERAVALPWRIWSERRAGLAAGAMGSTAWPVKDSWRLRIGIGCRARGFRRCTPMSSWPT